MIKRLVGSVLILILLPAYPVMGAAEGPRRDKIHHYDRHDRREAHEDDAREKKWDKEDLLAGVAAFIAILGAVRTLEMYDQKGRYDSLLPIFKLEADYQKQLQDIQGLHAGAELGFAFIGGDIDYTRFFESNPSQGFDIFSTHFLYRLALIKEAQLNFAIGYKKFFGDLQNDSLDLGLPLYLFPGKRWTIEAKPFFSVLNDAVVYDLAGGLRYKYKLVGIKGGYRFVRITGRDWHGPQVGLFFEW